MAKGKKTIAATCLGCGKLHTVGDLKRAQYVGCAKCGSKVLDRTAG